MSVRYLKLTVAHAGNDLGMPVISSTGLSQMEEIEKDLREKVNPCCYIQQEWQTLREIGSYCSLFIVLYMSVRYLKLTVPHVGNDL